MYSATTNHILVTVEPLYLEQQSVPVEAHYVWAYTIQVENHSEHAVKLINRYWHITDAQGMVEEVRGAGVVGEQPVLKPGEAFRYTSGANLRTPSGLMQGAYEMEDEAGDRFAIEVPAFSLDSPEQKMRPN